MFPFQKFSTAWKKVPNWCISGTAGLHVVDKGFDTKKGRYTAQMTGVNYCYAMVRMDGVNVDYFHLCILKNGLDVNNGFHAILGNKSICICMDVSFRRGTNTHACVNVCVCVCACMHVCVICARRVCTCVCMCARVHKSSYHACLSLTHIITHACCTSFIYTLTPT